jgi:hypothetical protein
MNNYKDIEFDEFLVDEDRILTQQEKNAYMNNFYKSTGLKSDNRNDSKVRETVRNSNVKGLKFVSRKLVTIAAAMVIVLAFGAFAYAAGWFDLGKIETKYDSYELIAVEDSAQYKAAKEVMDFKNGLSSDELIAYEGVQYEDTGKTNDANKSITFRGPTDIEKEVLVKYDLEFERTHFYVDSASKALENAGMGNIFGSFWDINQLRSSDDYVYDDGYIYTDKGSVSITGGAESQSDPLYWEIGITPRDVYISPWNAFVFPDAYNSPGYAEWEFVTDDGYHVKAATYVETPENSIGEGNAAYKNFKLLLITETHTIDFLYVINIDDPKNDMTKEEFEDMIEGFDFSKL